MTRPPAKERCDGFDAARLVGLPEFGNDARELLMKEGAR
jgi:hypothetical protein